MDHLLLPELPGMFKPVILWSHVVLPVQPRALKISQSSDSLNLRIERNLHNELAHHFLKFMPPLYSIIKSALSALLEYSHSWGAYHSTCHPQGTHLTAQQALKPGLLLGYYTVLV